MRFCLKFYNPLSLLHFRKLLDQPMSCYYLSIYFYSSNGRQASLLEVKKALRKRYIGDFLSGRCVLHQSLWLFFLRIFLEQILKLSVK